MASRDPRLRAAVIWNGGDDDRGVAAVASPHRCVSTRVSTTRPLTRRPARPRDRREHPQAEGRQQTAVSYRFHIADIAINAVVAVAHCPPLPADTSFRPPLEPALCHESPECRDERAKLDALRASQPSPEPTTSSRPYVLHTQMNARFPRNLTPVAGISGEAGTHVAIVGRRCPMCR
jgi:hypothetical protein